LGIDPCRRICSNATSIILGFPQKEPDLASLTELVKAHMFRVPYENVSKFYYKKYLGLHGIPDLELYLESIERYNFSATCYSNNYYQPFEIISGGKLLDEILSLTLKQQMCVCRNSVKTHPELKQ
jgi:hypothetical protein